MSNKKFDRIAMPLPMGGEDFLDIALGTAKKGTIIHFYDFLREEQIPKAAYEKIKSACKKAKKKCRIISYTKCGQYAPRTFRVCVDFKVN
jgi:tRNA G37 N-methylase Trm5